MKNLRLEDFPRNVTVWAFFSRRASPGSALAAASLLVDLVIYDERLGDFLEN